MHPATRDFQPSHRTITVPVQESTPRRSFHAPSAERQNDRNNHDLSRAATAGSPTHRRLSTWPTRRPSAHSLDYGVGLRRRKTRPNTIRSYHPPMRPGWEPGAEPGIDTSKETEDDLMKTLHADCDITVVDFSADRIKQHELHNSTLEEFLDEPKPDWASTRWICVDGISWDVIKLLGNNMGFHRLAIEDMINTKNRTKADWFVLHLFPTL